MSTVPMVFPGSPNVRSTDPLTSHEAADRMDVAGSQAEVLRILGGSGPMGDGDIFWRHVFFPSPAFEGKCFSEARLRTARHELVVDGFVVEAGEGVTRSGRRCKTWAVAQIGGE